MLTAATTAAVAVGGVVLRGVWSASTSRRARRRLGIGRGDRPPPQRVAAALEDADLGFPPEHACLAWFGLTTGIGAIGLAVAGPAAAVVLAAAAAVVPPAGVLTLRGRADQRLERALPGALELVARSLRAGCTLREALGDAATASDGRLAADLRTIVVAAEAGVPLVLALDEWPERRPVRGVRLAVAALALGATSGGATARAVDGVAATLRAGEAVAAEARSLAAQARLSALVIALAPIAFTLLAAGADPATLEFLLRTPIGLTCLAVGLALDGAAALWMHRLTAVRP